MITFSCDQPHVCFWYNSLSLILLSIHKHLDLNLIALGFLLFFILTVTFGDI